MEVTMLVKKIALEIIKMKNRVFATVKLVYEFYKGLLKSSCLNLLPKI